MKSKTKGFTLIELLIMITVIGSVVYFGERFLSQSRARAHLRQETGILQNLIKIGQATAITRQKTVVLCPSLDRKTCHNQWVGGYLLHIPSTGEKVSYQQRFHRNIQVHWSGVRGQNKLIFTPNLAQAMNNGTMEITKPGVGTQKLVLNRLGQVRLA